MKFVGSLILLSTAFLMGCSSSDSSATTAVETTPSAFKTREAPTVAFSVPDMMCPEGCGEKTKEILAGQPGAQEVMIDFESKRAIVAVEPEQFDAQAALAAMIDHGFDQTTLSEDAPQLAAPHAEADAAAVP